MLIFKFGSDRPSSHVKVLTNYGRTMEAPIGPGELTSYWKKSKKKKKTAQIYEIFHRSPMQTEKAQPDGQRIIPETPNLLGSGSKLGPIDA